MKKLLAFLLLCGAALGQATITGTQVVISGSTNIFVFVAIPPITITPENTGAVVGATVPFTAFFSDAFNNTAPACTSSGWTSSSPSIATINASTGVATAVAAGTTTISCAASSITGNATLVVEVAPNFSNPVTPCTAPCVLSGGTQSQAYSYTFAATGGTPAYTYSITVGSLPTGLTLTAGVISGTPSGTGTSTFTTQVCDSLSVCTSLQMSITVVAATGCTTTGPPTYTCASTSLADTTTPLTALFTSTTPTVNTCSGACQNATADDTQLPGHVAGTYKYTRISDPVSLNGKSVTNFTPSGGDNNRIFSYPNGQFLYVTTGQGITVFELTVSSGAFQVVNAGANPPIIRGLGIETSWTTETRFYHFSTTGPSAIYQGDLTGLVNGHVVNGTTSWTDTLLFDFFTAGNCPGPTTAGFTPSWKSDIGVSDNDDTFAVSIGPAGGQGHGYATFAYSKTKGVGGGPGCAVINFHTGQMWGFTACAPGSCTGAEAPTFTFSDVASQCWGSNDTTGNGIHNSQGSGDGNYVTVTRNSSWLKGGCTGTDSGPVVVNWSTGLNQYCNNNLYSCDGHNSEGITHDLHTFWQTGFNIRAYTDVTTPTIFFPMPNQQDQHCAWPHNNGGTFDDTLPWICAADAVTVALGGVYTPKYLNNEIFVVLPGSPSTQIAKRFGHTFSCNANIGAHCTDGIQDAFGPGNSIGIARPKADGFCFGSTMLHQLGNDNSGVPRADAFCVYMGN
jgi:hypothetical protein